jgi:hypothetical protein
MYAVQKPGRVFEQAAEKAGFVPLFRLNPAFFIL